MSNDLIETSLKRKHDEFEEPTHDANHEAAPDAKRLKTPEHSTEEQQATSIDVPNNVKSHTDVAGPQSSDDQSQSITLILLNKESPAVPQQPGLEVRDLQTKNESQIHSPLVTTGATPNAPVPGQASHDMIVKQNQDGIEDEEAQEQEAGDTDVAQVEDELPQDSEEVENHVTTSKAPHNNIRVDKFTVKTLSARSSSVFQVIYKGNRLPATTKWQECLPRQTISNNAGQTFSKGDIVTVTYDSSQDGVGKIVEVREGNEPVAVVQWLYDLAEARTAAMLIRVRVRDWPADQEDLRLESDHFDLVFGANLRTLEQQPAVHGAKFWSSRDAKVKDLSKLDEKMTTQLG